MDTLALWEEEFLNETLSSSSILEEWENEILAEKFDLFWKSKEKKKLAEYKNSIEEFKSTKTITEPVLYAIINTGTCLLDQFETPEEFIKIIKSNNNPKLRKITTDFIIEGYYKFNDGFNKYIDSNNVNIDKIIAGIKDEINSVKDDKLYVEYYNSNIEFLKLAKSNSLLALGDSYFYSYSNNKIYIIDYKCRITTQTIKGYYKEKEEY